MLPRPKSIEAVDLVTHLHHAISGMALNQRDEACFEALAVALFEKQYVENATYCALCGQKGKSPATVHHWHDIPAVTTSAFKFARLSCFAADPDEVFFQTSGTTTHGQATKIAGRHYFRTLDFYRAAALRTFKAYCLPDRDKMRLLILGPTAESFPHSSLGFMFSEVRKALGTIKSAAHFSPSGLAVANLIADVEVAIADGEPVFLLGTSLALLEFANELRHLGMYFQLPAGSRVLDTGGYKGRAIEISRPAFMETLCERFGLSPAFIINEYGMTELSSQFYESRLPNVPLMDERPLIKFAPPWTRVVAVDPATLEILPDGETGMLRIYDLANFDSVIAIQTEDLGRAWPDRMELLRRATGAELRGCSLLTESILRMT